MATRDNRIVGFIRKHPLGAYFLFFFTVGWGIGFIPVVAHAAWGTELPFQPFAIATTLIAGLLPAVVITRIVDGPEGVEALKRRVLRVRASFGWYAVALVAAPAVASLLAGLALGVPEVGSSTLATALLAGLVLQTVLVFVTINFAEEIGWMGFVQARLQDRHGPVRAAVFTAPLFALQHLPGMVGLGAALIIALPAFMVLTIGFRFAMGWIYNGTQSLFLVGLAHAASNGVASGSGFIDDGFLPRVYDGDLVTVLHMVAMFLIGVAALAATRGRLRYNASTEETPIAVPAPHHVVSAA